ncbi:Elongator subunit elp2 [Coemansia sp. RSA 2559]|nr:Elongator subunit elp2 [Coemansia sp. RSA 2559]
MVTTRTELISIACNRTAHALDWLDSSLIAFGAGDCVALYDPSTASKGIYATLQGHTKRVNCAQFARKETGERDGILVSGSADGTARVWVRPSWECAAVLRGHTGAVAAAATLCLDGGLAITVTAGTDGTLCVYEFRLADLADGPVELAPVQTVDVGARNALAVALATLPDGSVVLATGNTDKKVHVYTRDGGSAAATFVKALALDGHDDWVTTLAFAPIQRRAADAWAGNAAIAHWAPSDVVLASGSQDKYVRVWRIGVASEQQGADAKAVLDAVADSLRTGASIGDAPLSTRAHTLAVAQSTYAVSLDAVLLGHDGWVHSVAWARLAHEPALVTASADGSVMVWQPDADAGVWSSTARLGDAGSGALGFLGAATDAAATSVCAYGYHGALHAWAAQDGAWTPAVSPSGHFGAVHDVCWAPHGAYMLTASLDQTARLFAPCVASGWREIARPQIHGYDMRCAAFVSAFCYVSAADEKVVRVFRATQQSVAAWHALSAGSADAADAAAPGHSDGEPHALAVGAALPVLGLSNKAVDAAHVQALRDAADDTHQARRTHTDVVASAAIARAGRGPGAPQPPLEEDLLRHTLWPEVDKLYGHPYEGFAVAAAHAGDWVATACRATSERFAAIRLYSTRTWQPPVTTAGAAALPLAAHALTVTRLRFSPPAPTADRYLLSVSRDRSWALYERQPHADPSRSADGAEAYVCATGPYRLVARQQKAHMRIVWDAAWAPDARFFATASRDKTVKLWPAEAKASVGDDAAKSKPVVLAFPEPVTAIDFLPALLATSSGAPEYVLAAALESGRIFVLVGSGASGAALPAAWKPSEVPRPQTHAAMVRRLAWRPCPGRGALTEQRSWELASASDDHSVRIIAVDL